MAEDPRNRAFRAERSRQLRRLVAEHRAAAESARRLLADARAGIRARLAEAGLSDFQAFQLPQIERSIDQAMAELAEALAANGARGAANAHAIGVDLVDAPIAAGGVRIAGLLPEVDPRQLVAIRSFMTGRLRDVPRAIGERVKSQIGLVMIGAQTPGEAVGGISSLIEGGRGRAVTILRTEMGRAFSVAGQERMDQASELLPGLQKQWRRSGKIHSRVAHDLADGQIRDVDRAFDVGGIKLMYPRDPAAPAKHTVNCGCASLPFMESWDVIRPGRQPFSDDEIRNSRIKRDLDGALAA